MSVKPDTKMSGTLKGNGIGRYYYRAVAMADHIAYDTTRTTELFSYGTVTLEALCNYGTPGENENCGPGTVQIAGTVFTFIFNGIIPQKGGF